MECTCKMQVQVRRRDKDGTHAHINDAAKQEKERKREKRTEGNSTQAIDELARGHNKRALVQHMFSCYHYLSEAEMRGGKSGAQVDRALVVLLRVVVVAAGVVGAAQQIVRLRFHRFVLGVPRRWKDGYVE